MKVAGTAVRTVRSVTRAENSFCSLSCSVLFTILTIKVIMLDPAIRKSPQIELHIIARRKVTCHN